MKEEGVKIVVVNPNIATVQTSEGLADKVYFLPVKAGFVEKVIEKEKPQGILLSFGGQTALNCGLELYHNGILHKHNVEILGSPIKAVEESEDRHLFVKKLDEIKVKTAKGTAVNSVKKALQVAEKIGYPVMMRSGFSLGGKGSGIAKDEKELREMAAKVFAELKQAIVEECLTGWKEVEYEVVRDQADNCITVCNMENLDPIGIHTGESIVVAPSQTLSNTEYHFLRELSLKIIRHLGIVGECNVQFALDPETLDYRVIEVNARLSRSSALASKATGYPLAFITAKLALGFTLPELLNSITLKTIACFEPALDYCVVKVPRWDLKKFQGVSKQIGSSMKSVGEVMAIGRGFEEALQKAVRMTGLGFEGVACTDIRFDDLGKELCQPTDERLFALAEALRQNQPVESIYRQTKVDPWFLHKIKNIVGLEEKLKGKKLEELDKDLLLEAKKKGFSDRQIGLLCQSSEETARKKRQSFGVRPFVKQIDSLAAEFPAQTNYLYLTYNASEDDLSGEKEKSVAILGSGAYSIGSSVEFDWCCVHAALTARKLGLKTTMINFNPETVSTDYDLCDRLYFEELNLETVLEINAKENPSGFIVSMGGQIPNNLALKMHQQGLNIYGTSSESIDSAENRKKFSSLMEKLEVSQPKWKALSSLENALAFAKDIEYPVLVRPSYVLSGSAMNVAFNEASLKSCLKAAAKISKDCPVVISKFIVNAKELEFDGVAFQGRPVLWAISEHIENAGVHSGDATIVFPAQRTYMETVQRIEEIAAKVAGALKINGPFNIQFIAKDNEVKVIECNLRCSRSFPFVSKVLGRNLVEAATQCMLGKKPDEGWKKSPGFMGVKAPQFSFSRLHGADPILKVEMASTGEVACLSHDFFDALLKAMLATGVKLPKKNVLLSIGGEMNRFKLLKAVKRLQRLGFNLFATEHTSEFLKQQGIKNKTLHKLHTNLEPNALTYIRKGKLDFVVNIPNSFKPQSLGDSYALRRAAVDFSIPLITNAELAKAFTKALEKRNGLGFEIKAWQDYLKNKGNRKKGKKK